jgi:CHAT domain-containing protein
VGFELWRLLFADLLQSSRHGTSLIVRADQEMNSLPLGYLAAEFGGPYSIREAVMRPWGGAHAWSNPSGNSSAILVSATSVSPHVREALPFLPQLDRELAHARQFLPGAVTLAGAAACPSRLRSAVQSASILHFAGHSIRWKGGLALVAAPDPQASDQSDRDGIWTISPGNRMALDLAVLSACSTAARDEQQTVAPERLAEAFLLGGAKRVLASLWDIDSKAAIEFHAEFYRVLSTGRTPGQAALEAARALAREAGMQHPYYWAPFVVYEL